MIIALIVYAIIMSAAILYVGFRRKWFWKKKKREGKYKWSEELGSLYPMIRSLEEKIYEEEENDKI